jgi:acyl carrier protein
MQRADVLEELTAFIANDVLDGRDVGLDSQTPLLEWGVINSLEVMRLLTFIRTRFNVAIPPQMVVPEHFQDLDSLSDLVMDLAAESGSAVG